VVYGGEFIHPNRVVHEAANMLQTLTTIMVGGNDGLSTGYREDLETWEKPPFGLYKVNWDVAIDKNMQCMGFGAVIRDHNRLVCAAKCMKIEGIQEPVVGEAMAALAAVEFSKEGDFQDVILEGDSLQVVQVLKEMGPNWRPYGHIVDDAKALLCTCRS
jgi:hypothetical protein